MCFSPVELYYFQWLHLHGQEIISLLSDLWFSHNFHVNTLIDLIELNPNEILMELEEGVYSFSSPIQQQKHDHVNA